jgi:hypothetical protein
LHFIIAFSVGLCAAICDLGDCFAKIAFIRQKQVYSVVVRPNIPVFGVSSRPKDRRGRVDAPAFENTMECFVKEVGKG